MFSVTTVGFVVVFDGISFVYYFFPARLLAPKILDVVEGAVDELLFYPVGALIVVFNAYFP
jgi:hypothetical protein